MKPPDNPTSPGNSQAEQRRPTVFVGSSAEALPVAHHIQLNLDHDCEVTVWNQGLFGIGSATLETLVDRLHDFDFAILVLGNDDFVESRGKGQNAPRDNVLIELGMFIGGLGRERTFVVFDRKADLKIPSDLAGVTPATYQAHTTGNLAATLGAPCTLIRTAISTLGLREEANVGLSGDTEFLTIRNFLEPASIQFLILMRDQDCTLPRGGMLTPGLTYRYASGRTQGEGSYSFDRLCGQVADADLLSQDLRNNLSLTDRGESFVDYLVESGDRASFFECPMGGWGEEPEELRERRLRLEASERDSASGSSQE